MVSSRFILYSSHMASTTMIQPSALEWLVGSEPTTTLLVGASSGYASLLVRAGHAVTVMDPDTEALKEVAFQVPGVHIVAGKAESLPFDPGCFSSVLSIQNFHTFASGMALGEWARVLKYQGTVGLAYMTRDDTVPWVNKLKRIVQYYLPHAMSSDYGSYSVAAFTAAAYFPQVEKISFRHWIPSTKTELQESACNTTGASELGEERRAAMLEEIGELYDQYARIPNPLLLPYTIQCWKAVVDQSSLTMPLIPGDDGLSIPL